MSASWTRRTAVSAIIAAAIGLAALAAGPPADAALRTATATAKPSAKIELYRGHSKRDGGTRVEYFVATDRVQYVYARLPKLKVGNTSIRWVFTAVKTEAGKNIEIASAKASSLVANEVDGQLSLPRDFPLGTYRVDLFVDGKLAGVRTYEVRAK